MLQQSTVVTNNLIEPIIYDYNLISWIVFVSYKSAQRKAMAPGLYFCGRLDKLYSSLNFIIDTLYLFMFV